MYIPKPSPGENESELSGIPVTEILWKGVISFINIAFKSFSVFEPHLPSVTSKLNFVHCHAK